MSSDEETIEIPRELAGEWWYFAGQLRMALGHKQGDPDWEWFPTPTASGCIIHIGPRLTPEKIARILFVGKGGNTTLLVHTIPSNWPDVQPLIDDLVAMASEARDARRGSLGETFREILDDYYERKARGESPILRDMARRAGVNIGSLRQAKIRYDKQRHEQNVSGD